MGLLDRLQLVPNSDSEDAPEIGPEFDQDPDPGERPRRAVRKRTPAAATPRKQSPSVAKMAKEVSEDLTSLIEMGAAIWGMTDECCAPTLETQARPIAESITAILSRNPRLLAKFADTDLVAYSVQAGMLFKALKPVATTVYHNHVSKTVEEGATGDGIHLGNFPAFSAAVAR